MLQRASEAVVARSLREFPVTTLTGLRQVGKRSLVQSFRRRHYVTLDDLGALEAARRDPAGFVEGLPRPVTIDEVQRAPEVLLPIKASVDRRRRPGEFLLTGSAHIELRRGARETLAGRGALLRLRPMTWAERAARPAWNPIDVLLTSRSAGNALSRFPGPAAPFEAALIVAGGLPVPLLDLGGPARGRWFDQYRSSYVARDVPPLVRIDEVGAFLRFVALAAARTAQTTNYAALGRECGVATDTVVRWTGVLDATFLIDLVPPWFRNIGKRLVRSPKLHFGDAGLAAHFAGAASWKEATRMNIAGPLLETLVAQHLLAFAETAARPTSVFHYRTQAGAESDFVLSRGPRLIPVEVKAAATLRSQDASGLRAFLADHSDSAPFGVVLYTGGSALSLGDRIIGLPLSSVLAGPRTA